MPKKIPPVLWISIAALGIVSGTQLIIGVRSGRYALFLAFLLDLVLLAGLAYGRKWAFVATLVLALAGLIMSLGQGFSYAMSVLLGNALVVVPMLLSTRFFFPDRTQHPADHSSREVDKHGT